MEKIEFMMRFMRIAGQKSRKFKSILMPFFEKESECDADFLLSELQLTSEQKAQFNQVSEQEITYLFNWLEREKHHLMFYSDTDYPELLRQISAAPLMLFVIGHRKALKQPQIAMVGSRQFSHYGAHWARFFAKELTQNGMTITSGLALGIDALSHRGALDAGGQTIAVLGSGLDQISPKSNLPLAYEIVQNKGALVSEFLPWEQAKPEFFPRRNRIISGLSLGTFIVEASEKSGSLITARYALEQNRDVFALPSDIQTTYQSGTNALIQQGAYLVSNPKDILAHYENALTWIQKSQIEQESADLIHPRVFALMTKNPISADEIADQLDEPITEILIQLVELELEGLISVVSGGYIRA